MRAECVGLSGVVVIHEEITQDKKRWRSETYSWPQYHSLGVKTLFTVDFYTQISFKNTLRGLYYQNDPAAQSLLVRCTKGAIIQAVVDIRPGSETYGKGVLVELRAGDGESVYIPQGFAQGILSLADNTELFYKADKPCYDEFEQVLNYADPALELAWPSIEGELIISVQDQQAPLLGDIACNYL